MKQTSDRSETVRAVRMVGHVDRRGRLVVRQPVEAPEGDVEIILLLPEMESRRGPRRRSRSVLDEPFLGMWKDRDDIPDSASFVEGLRGTLEKRADRA
jgi:hypothetical protein